MKCVCMNPEVKKLDITGMTTATNGACMGWLHENCYLMAEGMTLSIGGDVNLLREAFLVGGVGEGRQSTPGGGNKATSKKRAFLVPTGI